MIKLKHYRRKPFLLALAIVCAVAPLRPQENFSGQHALPVVIDHKQAEGLAVAQPAPEYPPVAKVNYVQGHVQLELTVNGKGKVDNAHVLEGVAILAESALKATRLWSYHPLDTPSGPSGFITRVKLNFTLHYRETDLTPRQAEHDFLRQVKPPEVVRLVEDAPPGDTVRMRLLVDDHGQVVDMDALPMKAQFDAARETLRGWTFRPAHWGSLPIASYLEVDVPVGAPDLARATANSSNR